MNNEMKRELANMYDMLTFDEVKSLFDQYVEWRHITRNAMRTYWNNQEIMTLLRRDMTDVSERIDLAIDAMVRKP